MRTPIVILTLLLTLPLVAASPLQSYTWMPAQGEPSPEFGPDVPASPLPMASVVAFNDEVWSFTAGQHHRTINVPSGWTRVVMVYRQNPTGDPWDRLFQAFIGGAEVLRGAAPRTDMTITKDMTRYASLLPQGGTADIAVDTSEWTGGKQHVWVTLNFYDDATSALVERPATSVIPVYQSGGICGTDGRSAPLTVTNVTFPSGPNATVEFFATNHGREEGYRLSTSFDIVVDGKVVTTVVATQYRYAWIGIGGPQPYANDVVHKAVWWSVFQALEVAGVHTGVGEIPPYRLALDASQMALLPAGTHTVSVQAHGLYDCVWITSLNFLMEN